jgi:diguanylate cyclase (GGDEF)-like protein
MASERANSHSPGAGNRPILSIRARLVVLALLAIVPLMLERVRLLEASRSERLAAAAAEVVELAKQGVDGQREVITSVQAVLKVLTHTYVTMRARGESCNFYLRDFASNMPWIKGASIADGNGRVICSTTESAVGVDLSDRSYFLDAMKSGNFVVSNYLIGRIQQQPTLVAAYPTHAVDHLLEGVIIASVDLHWVGRLTASISRREGAAAMLVDGHGTVLTRHPQATPWVGRAYPDHPLIREVLAKTEGTTVMPGLDGVRRIYAFVRVPWTDAQMVVGLPERELLHRVDRDIYIAYLQLIGLCVLVLIAAWFGGERLIVEPIHALARTATRFGRGELDVRLTPESWAKEFRPLAASLNEMARRLAERENELRSSNHHLAELASVDALSGLANRRAFDTRLQAEWQRGLKLNRPLALLMIDVDHFKAFNDHYGHVEGDACLRKVGVTLGSIADHDGDFAARYGGEEFVLLLPAAELDQALKTAERLREAVQALAVAHAAAPCGQITISVGVASLVPSTERSAGHLIEAADAGLYAAKRRGRDAVVAHAPVVLANAS